MKRDKIERDGGEVKRHERISNRKWKGILKEEEKR